MAGRPRESEKGTVSVIKIQTRVSKRHYMKAKRTYEYGRMSLDIPKKFHEALKPFLEKELQLDVKLENNAAIISLSPRENVSACRKHPRQNTVQNHRDYGLGTPDLRFCLNTNRKGILR